jgi:hypothetical protein
MRTDPNRRAGLHGPAAGTARRSVLRFEELEPRDVPAIFFQIDYSRDTGFFANNPEARATLERAAFDLGVTLSANLSAIVPNGSNSFSASFFDPTTGAQVVLPNLTVGANTVRVFVGARAMPGVEAGSGGPGGYGASGSAAWLNLAQTRGHTGFAPWGGSVAFDSTERWHFGATTAGLDADELDFYSVAIHELGHIAGLGTAPQWRGLTANGLFYGPNAMATYGGPVPLSPDGAHWADGLTYAGRPATLDPVLNYGTRVGWGGLDAAALRDIGWANAPAPVVPLPAPAPPPAPAVVIDPQQLLAVPVPAGGVEFYQSGPTGLIPLGRLVPFAGYTGAVDVTAGDFDGDGVRDFAFSTASAGPNSAVRVISGRGFDIVGPTVLLPGFTLGVTLAAADVDGNGRSELVVAAGAGGLPVVGLFDAGGGALGARAVFVAFDAPSYRGGVRVAAGDVNRDGFGDVVVTSATGVGAVGVYSGESLRFGVARLLWAPALPFGAAPFGLIPSVGDFDRDGRPDIGLTQTGGARGQLVMSGATLVPPAPARAAPAPRETATAPASRPTNDTRRASEKVAPAAPRPALSEPVYSATVDPVAACACVGCRSFSALVARSGF